jgi:thiosulfate/3-mercaptopyruvate sulfurtransferase
MIPSPLPPLVSTGWLAAHLTEPGLVILDTSWYLPTTGRSAAEEFLVGHLPGALFFDLDAASDETSPLPHMLPSESAFARYVGSLGIGGDSAIVVYDTSGGNMSAARVWWMFRAFGHATVAVLDGGLGKWREEGRPVEAGEVRATPRRLVARLDAELVRTRSQVSAALLSGAAQVVDTRSAGRFQGTAPEPRAGLPSGHMPGAINLPYTELVHADGTALTHAELRTRLAAAGVQVDRPVIATCGSGTSACTLLHALFRLGHDHAALYDGSWTEWAGSGMPVVEGER